MNAPERGRFEVLRALVAATPVSLGALVDAARVLAQIGAGHDTADAERSQRAVAGGEPDER